MDQEEFEKKYTEAQEELVIEETRTQENVKTKEQESFDEVLHRLLIIGLFLSVALILTGLILSWINHVSIPTAVPNLKDIFLHVKDLQPAGFIALGLLVLMATPIVRVISSVIAFLIQRDWRFAGITMIVLITVMISVLLGNE